MSATPSFAFVAHDAFVADIRTLAAAIAADAWRPTRIVGIGRGGLVPAVYLSHAAGLPMLSCDWSSDDTAAAIVGVADRTRAGEQLLVIDDIKDSGLTIGAVRAALMAAGAIGGAIRFAVLIDNRLSAERIDYRARTIDRSVTKDWFVFPWEAVASEAALIEDAAAVPQRIEG